MIQQGEDLSVPFSQKKRSDQQHFSAAWGAAASILKSVWKVMLLWGLGVVLQCHRKPQCCSSSCAQSPQGECGTQCIPTHGELWLPCTLTWFYLLSVNSPAQIFVLIAICYRYCKCQSVINNILYHHTASSFTVAAVNGDILLNRKMTHWTIAQLDYKRMFVLRKKLSLRFPPLLISVFPA